MQKHVAILKTDVKTKGGLEKAAHRIASGFSEKGAKVSILTTGKTDLPHVHAIQTIGPQFFKIEQFDHFVQKWVDKWQPDIVFGMDRNRYQTHIRAGNGVHAAFLKSRILTEGKLKYFSCLLNPFHRKILQIEKEAFENPNLQKVFANSKMVKQEIINHFQINPQKIEILYNGVEWKELTPHFQQWDDVKMTHYKNFNLDPDAFQFLFIGNGFLRKGLSPLLKALPLLKNQNYQLSIVGKDKNLSKFQNLAAPLKVKFFGPQTNVFPFYQMADATLIPSFYDPFANITVESLAMGVPVISSKTNGGSEILNNQNGFIIDDLLSIESIADTMDKAMDQKKTMDQSILIRETVKHLDFSNYLQTLIQSCHAS